MSELSALYAAAKVVIAATETARVNLDFLEQTVRREEELLDSLTAEEGVIFEALLQVAVSKGLVSGEAHYDSLAELRAALKSELVASVTEMLAGITQLESTILCYTYGINEERPKYSFKMNRTQAEIGRLVGSLTQPQVSAKYKKAMRKLRHPTRSDYAKQFLFLIDPDNIANGEEALLYDLNS